MSSEWLNVGYVLLTCLHRMLKKPVIIAKNAQKVVEILKAKLMYPYHRVNN